MYLFPVFKMCWFNIVKCNTVYWVLILEYKHFVKTSQSLLSGKTLLWERFQVFSLLVARSKSFLFQLKKKKKKTNKKSQALCQLPPKYSRKVSLLPVLHYGHGGSKKLINLLNVTLQVRGEVRIQMQVLISMILASLMPFCFHRVLLLSCHLLIRKYLTRIRRTKKCDRWDKLSWIGWWYRNKIALLCGTVKGWNYRKVVGQ